MKNIYNESPNYSVFNDFEESIMFDKDDPDFKPAAKADKETSCNHFSRHHENGKLEMIKYNIIETKFK